jgi:tetratricopeptide (TPR) repeat protein
MPRTLIMRLAIFALLGTPPLRSPAASGETTAVLAVSEPPGPSPELIEITRQVRQALAERSPGILEAQRVRERMAGPDVPAQLLELDRTYDAARTAYQNGDFATSIRSFRAVTVALAKLPPGDDVFQAWTRAMLRLAKAESDLGHPDEARDVLDQLVRAAPAVAVDPELYPPKFTRLVEEAKGRLLALPTRSLAIGSTLPGTRAYVNGRPVGEAPLKVDLAAGTYRVSGRSGALRSAAIEVDLGASNQELPLDFSVAQSLRPSLGPGLALAEPGSTRGVVSAGALLGLDVVVTVSLDGPGILSGRVFDVRKGIPTREGKVRLVNGALPLGGATALAEFLATGSTASGLVLLPGQEGLAVDLSTPALPGSAVDLSKTGTPTGGAKALGWTAFGTGVAAVGLGGVAIWQLLSSNSSYSQAQSMLDPSGALPPGSDPDLYRSLIASGDSSRQVAVITGVSAGVCLVATGVLGYLSVKQTGELGPFRF